MPEMLALFAAYHIPADRSARIHRDCRVSFGVPKLDPPMERTAAAAMHQYHRRHFFAGLMLWNAVISKHARRLALEGKAVKECHLYTSIRRIL